MQGLTLQQQGPSEVQQKLLRPGTVDFGAAANAFMSAIAASGSNAQLAASGSGSGAQGGQAEPQALQQKGEPPSTDGSKATESKVSDEELMRWSSKSRRLG